jgi:hypothetical protein
LTNVVSIYGYTTISRQLAAYSSGMASENWEGSVNIVLGAAGVGIAFAALFVAFLQLKRMRRVRQIYELA